MLPTTAIFARAPLNRRAYLSSNVHVSIDVLALRLTVGEMTLLSTLDDCDNGGDAVANK